MSLSEMFCLNQHQLFFLSKIQLRKEENLTSNRLIGYFQKKICFVCLIYDLYFALVHFSLRFSVQNTHIRIVSETSNLKYDEKAKVYSGKNYFISEEEDKAQKIACKIQIICQWQKRRLRISVKLNCFCVNLHHSPLFSYPIQYRA